MRSSFSRLSPSAPVSTQLRNSSSVTEPKVRLSASGFPNASNTSAEIGRSKKSNNLATPVQRTAQASTLVRMRPSIKNSNNNTSTPAASRMSSVKTGWDESLIRESASRATVPATRKCEKTTHRRRVAVRRGVSSSLRVRSTPSGSFSRWLPRCGIRT